MRTKDRKRQIKNYKRKLTIVEGYYHDLEKEHKRCDDRVDAYNYAIRSFRDYLVRTDNKKALLELNKCLGKVNKRVWETK